MVATLVVIGNCKQIFINKFNYDFVSSKQFPKIVGMQRIFKLLLHVVCRKTHVKPFNTLLN